MSTLTVMPSPVQTFLYPSGAPVANGVVYFYAAGSTTLQDTYSDVGGTIANTNPVILDSAGKATIYWLPTAYRVVLYDSVANGSAQIWDRDNIAAIPFSTGYPDVPAVAGEALIANNGVYLSDGLGGKTPGRWYLWDQAHTYSSTLPEIGIVVSTSIASGSIGSVRLLGQMTGFNALTAGQDYTLGTAGALTTGTARYIGRADSSTSIILGPNQDPLNNIQSSLFAITAALGTWTDVPFNAANFTASSGTWTVGSGDVLRNRYQVLNKILFWTLQLQTTDVSATPATLRVAIPTGTFASLAQAQRVDYLVDNTTYREGIIQPGDTTHLYISRADGGNFSVSSAATIVFVSAWWEVA